MSTERETKSLYDYISRPMTEQELIEQGRVLNRKTQHLHIPLTRGHVIIPFPMTEEDFELIQKTMYLWKTKLTT